MSLIETDWHPERKKVRGFGVTALIASVFVSFALYFLKGVGLEWVLVIFVAGAVIFAACLLSQRIGRVIYVGLIAVTMPIGLAVSFVVMALFYYFLLTPVGLVFRLTGRDILHRKFDPNAETYWRVRQRQRNLGSYFRQF